MSLSRGGAELCGAARPQKVGELESSFGHLDLLPQNRQDIPWKSLALEPHFFGNVCKKLGETVVNVGSAIPRPAQL
jgi:hypothetical protein